MSSTIKLQAFLAHAGIASRRKAEEFIEQGFVSVNGQRAHVGQRVSEKDKVLFQGKPVTQVTQHVYYLINKPVGLVSTTSDELGRTTVLSLLPKEARRLRLYPVGRLDQDSQGLMLLTDDGDVAYRLTHPKFEVSKTYEVTLDRSPTSKAVESLTRGVRLTDGFAKPLLLEQLEDTVFSITITEGRNRQVRRMIARIGYDVTALKRVVFGPFVLGDLPKASARPLTTEEISQLKAYLKMLK